MLDIAFTTLGRPSAPPVIVGRAFNASDVEVTIPLCDARRAKFSLNVYDPACLHVLPLTRLVKIRYRGRPIFCGRVVNPVWSPDESKVEVNCIGQVEFGMMHHHLHNGDSAVNAYYMPDGNGAWDLVSAAKLSPGLLALDIPDLGVARGVDGVPPLDPLFNPNLKRTAERLDGVWDHFMGASDIRIFPEWRFQPIDEHYDPNGRWAAGIYAQLDTYERKGLDRSDTVVWHYGWGRHNASGFTYSPAGDATINYAVASSGELTGLKHNRVAQAAQGVLASADSSGADADSQEILDYAAEKTVAAYSEPPQAITWKPSPRVAYYGGQPIDPILYPDHFEEGDVVRVIAKKGYMPTYDENVRVTQIKVVQPNRSVEPSVEVEGIPHIVDDADIVNAGAE